MWAWQLAVNPLQRPAIAVDRDKAAVLSRFTGIITVKHGEVSQSSRIAEDGNGFIRVLDGVNSDHSVFL